MKEAGEYEVCSKEAWDHPLDKMIRLVRDRETAFREHTPTQQEINTQHLFEQVRVHERKKQVGKRQHSIQEILQALIL
jgi:hypothetical protein